MRHHGGHVWERKSLFDVCVGVGDVIVTDIDIVCLDCGERRNIVCTTPISSIMPDRRAVVVTLVKHNTN